MQDSETATYKYYCQVHADNQDTGTGTPVKEILNFESVKYP